MEAYSGQIMEFESKWWMDELIDPLMIKWNRYRMKKKKWKEKKNKWINEFTIQALIINVILVNNQIKLPIILQLNLKISSFNFELFLWSSNYFEEN